MKIKECFVKGKSPNLDLCEDELIITDNFVVVLDGVTSKSGYLWNGITSGKMAVEVIKDTLGYIEENVSAMAFFSHLSFALKQRYNLEFKKNIPDEKLRCAVIAYSDFAHEVWSYGDCQCMINGNLYRNEKKLDHECALIRSSILKEELEAGKSMEELLIQDIGREKIISKLKEQYQYENKLVQYGYPVLNGDDIEPVLMKKYSVCKGDSIVLATDGYPILRETLAESEKELKMLLKKDPLCIEENLSTKGLRKGNDSFDDRCYCRFVVN